MGGGTSKSTTNLVQKAEKGPPTEKPPAAPVETPQPTDTTPLATSEDTKPKFHVVFVLGGPGSGKGTNCVKIKEKFAYEHLSAGDLLRAERESGSELAEMINTNIQEGKIVPADVTVGLLRKAMESSGKQKFLVDGFPRDLSNLEAWDKTMSDIADVAFLLFLDCPNDVVVQRLLERGKTSGRNDDNIETIQKRLVTYENATRPIIEHFRSLEKVRQVDANKSEDEVFADVSKCFE
jgi:UMP-CMP kinase